MKVGDLVKIKHDSRTLGIVVALGNSTPETDRWTVLEGPPTTYRVWVSWNYLGSDIESMWNWQLDEIS